MIAGTAAVDDCDDDEDCDEDAGTVDWACGACTRVGARGAAESDDVCCAST